MSKPVYTPRSATSVFLTCAVLALLCAPALLLDGMLYLVAAVFATMAQTVLFRLFSPILSFGVAALSVLLTFLAGSLSVPALLLACAPPLCALLLAGAIRRGEDRFSAVLTLTAALSGILLLLSLHALWRSAAAAGTADLLTHLRAFLDALLAELTAMQLEQYRLAGELLAEAGVEYVLPTAGEVRTMMAQLMSLLPGAFFLLLAALSLGLTYALHLVSAMMDEPLLFDRRHSRYLPGPLVAVLYLAAGLITLVYRDYSSVFSVCCINLTLILSPMLAFGGLLGLRRFFAFLRRSSSGGLDYAFWLILLVFCAVAYLRTVILILAVWQAIYILKSAFSSRKREGR